MKSERKKKELSLKGFLILFVGYTALLTLGTVLFSRAGHEAAVRSNVKDIRHWAAAISAYISEHGTAPTNPHGLLHPKIPFVRELIPYLKYIRMNDHWGETFRIWTGPGNHIYGIKTSGSNDFIIASYGARGNLDGWDISHRETAFFSLKKKSSFQHDIVYFNGRFIHGPFFTQPDQEDRLNHPASPSFGRGDVH
ncbi:MAG: hypothetical protein MUP70_16060 [Candidatus Aminicenantes bacterium]|nr:hypothetical protein [Candidatus Aminicenantes bacterium]